MSNTALIQLFFLFLVSIVSFYQKETIQKQWASFDYRFADGYFSQKKPSQTNSKQARKED